MVSRPRPCPYAQREIPPLCHHAARCTTALFEARARSRTIDRLVVFKRAVSSIESNRIALRHRLSSCGEARRSVVTSDALNRPVTYFYD